jgi:hypothetical protein
MNQKILTRFANFCKGRTFSYCDYKVKQELHTLGKSVLRQIAKALNLQKGEYYIRSNKAGIACSGEITLHAKDFYFQIQPDSFMRGKEILLRGCNGLKDYTGKINHFLSIQDLKNGEFVLKCISNARN